jgi:hypothetical protein
VESMEVVSAPNYAALSLNLSTDVKPCFISRRNLENTYRNGFVHGKVRLLGGGGGLFLLRLLKAGGGGSVTKSRDLR